MIQLNLYEQIIDLRKEMVRTGLEKGLTHHETLKLSQKLDVLIYQYLNKNKE
ncbi:aspartyl-phosphate phosphatase Spo0E family protein [Piscibacillus salipiscarius]|uniref:Aspartyl-phosphate phosphatase Spo0E family protein n=1 Tax=Piscibacillus salipiscarius TaxID=299480 RepID=A0ABW5Q8S5_9BACI|nr:aspartyl-phosphate phosphatase Spo0E family protein [Piscibacillus salipiscarius]